MLPHPLFVLPLLVVRLTPLALGLCSFALVQPCMPSVCTCCGCCCAYRRPCAACAHTRLFNLACLWFVPIHTCLTLRTLGLCPFAFVCSCWCRSCCGCRCAYVHPHAGPWFVCAHPARVSSICNTLPVKAILVFFNRKLYLPLACGEVEDAGNVDSKYHSSGVSEVVGVAT